MSHSVRSYILPILLSKSLPNPFRLLHCHCHCGCWALSPCTCALGVYGNVVITSSSLVSLLLLSIRHFVTWVSVREMLEKLHWSPDSLCPKNSRSPLGGISGPLRIWPQSFSTYALPVCCSPVFTQHCLFLLPRSGSHSFINLKAYFLGDAFFGSLGIELSSERHLTASCRLFGAHHTACLIILFILLEYLVPDRLLVDFSVCMMEWKKPPKSLHVFRELWIWNLFQWLGLLEICHL